MPNFPDPFSGMVPNRKMNTRELTRALRLDIAAEQEAIHLYEAQADATNDQLASRVLQDLADEERVHVGELQKLLNIVLENEEVLFEEGLSEVSEMAEELQRKRMGEEKMSFKNKGWYRIAQEKPHTTLIPSKMNLPKDELESSKLTTILRIRDIKTAIMCSDLGRDCEEILLSRSDAMAETEKEREKRNAAALKLRNEFRQKKFKEWYEEDPGISQNQKDTRKKEFRKKLEEYLDAGLSIMWEKLKQSSGNTYAEKLLNAADMISEDMIEERRRGIKLGLWSKEQEFEEEEDTYQSTYDGSPINVSKEYSDTKKINPDLYINLTINPSEINDNNITNYTGDAVRAINEAELLLDRAKKIKEGGPEKDNLRRNAILRFLEAYKIYQSVLESNGVREEITLRIAKNRLKSIEEQLIVAGFPKIMERTAQRFFPPDDSRAKHEIYSPQHIGSTEEEILNSTNAHTSHAILNYAYLHPEANIDALEDALIKTNDAYYMLLFAINIPNANIEKLQNAIIDLTKQDWRYSQYLEPFAKEVPGADVKKIINVIRDLS